MCFSLHRCRLRLMWIIIVSSQNQDRPLFTEILVKFTYLVGMIAGKNLYGICFTFFFYLMASPTAYGQMPKFFRAEHSATVEGENCAYGPTLGIIQKFSKVF